MARPERESGQRRLAAARDGCPDALGQTLEGCRKYLLWIARRQIDPDLQSKGGASDVVQETFLEARRDFDRFHGTSEAELLAWLRRLLLNNLSNFARHYRATAKRAVGDEVSLEKMRSEDDRDSGLADGAASPSDEASAREQTMLLQAALARLSEEHRRVMALWHQEELSFEEIGRRLGCSPNTARSRWLKAIKRLQEDLGERGASAL